jgi:hypothetical protein
MLAQPTHKVDDIGKLFSNQPTIPSLPVQFDSEVKNTNDVISRPMHPLSGPQFVSETKAGGRIDLKNVASKGASGDASGLPTKTESFNDNEEMKE